MTSAMARIEVAGPLDAMPAVIDSLQRQGSVHVVDLPLSECPASLRRATWSAEKLRERDALAEVASALSEAAEAIPPDVRASARERVDRSARYAKWKTSAHGEIVVAARSLHATARAVARRRRNIAEDLRAAEGLREMVDALINLVDIPKLPKDFRYFAILLEGATRNRRDALERLIRGLTEGRYALVETLISRKRFIALIGVPAPLEDAALTAIDAEGPIRVALPRHLRGVPFVEAVRELRGEMDELLRKREEIEGGAQDFYAKSAEDILALLDVCRDALERYDVMKLIAVTRRGFLLRGWAPATEIESIMDCVREASAGAASARVLRPGKGETPPVKLDLPAAAKPFEPLSRLFPLPRYGTVDPTGYLAAVFPPLFGLMLADIGYGLMLAAAAGLALLRSPRRSLGRKLALVALSCAVYAVLFGALFGELFGESGKALIGLRPIWRERFTVEGGDKAELLLGYMALAISIGVVHVLLGLILGFLNSLRAADKGRSIDALAKIAGLFALFLGGGLLVGLLPRGLTTALVAVLVAFAALILRRTLMDPAHGLLLPLEVLGTVGNILSYVRIMAVGLVSVVLAHLAAVFGSMVGGVILAAIIAIFVHALNLALGIADSTIQGLRLHYVEFSSKFFLGGGVPYSPFRTQGGRS